MASSVFDSAIYRELLHDDEIGALFGDRAEVDAMIRVEAALAGVQGELGVIPRASAELISQGLARLQIDPASLAAGTGQQGQAHADLRRYLDIIGRVDLINGQQRSESRLHHLSAKRRGDRADLRPQRCPRLQRPAHTLRLGLAASVCPSKPSCPWPRSPPGSTTPAPLHLPERSGVGPGPTRLPGALPVVSIESV